MSNIQTEEQNEDLCRFRWIGLSDDQKTVTLQKFEGNFLVHPAAPTADGELVRGVAVDVETTGTVLAQDVVIEIGLREFQFTKRTGKLVWIGEPYVGLEDPGRPLSPAIQRLTGLTDEKLAGQMIDWEKVNEIFSRSDWVIAHNSAFDRPYIERKVPSAKEKVWGCSLKQVHWTKKGFDVKKLNVLCIYHGFFVDSHRALNDVDALIHLMSHPDPSKTDGTTYFAEAYAGSLKPIVRVIASQSPFETKDALRGRGYRWNPKERYWHKSIGQELLQPEIQWLEQNVYSGEFRGQTIEIPLERNFAAR